MFRLNFKAGVATASKNSADNYYMIGLADDEYDYKNYLLFQRSIRLGQYEDADAPHNGLCAERNDDVCYNGCKAVKITSEFIVFEVQDSVITVDISGVKIPKRFIQYCKEIFGDLLSIEGQI
ncbi:Imm10 family immunity protein [uncultured Campylobacter sp.]|uniref:Imm10 family immunity protein n=1 Tax=uncultured Campylobacter sp. TaxID=218934 RepID=UPI0026293F54|nr:Imm10 family immunity protein [uncultured Campylobacter sp.]